MRMARKFFLLVCARKGSVQTSKSKGTKVEKLISISNILLYQDKYACAQFHSTFWSFFSFGILNLCWSPGLLSATRLKWWRTRWTQCGRPSPSPSGPSVTETMRGNLGPVTCTWMRTHTCAHWDCYSFFSANKDHLPCSLCQIEFRLPVFVLVSFLLFCPKNITRSHYPLAAFTKCSSICSQSG